MPSPTVAPGSESVVVPEPQNAGVPSAIAPDVTLLQVGISNSLMPISGVDERELQSMSLVTETGVPVLSNGTLGPTEVR